MLLKNPRQKVYKEQLMDKTQSIFLKIREQNENNGLN